MKSKWLWGLAAVMPMLALRRSAHQRRLAAEELRYRTLFENSPVAMWEEDFSRIRALIERLLKAGVGNLAAHFQQHPKLVEECIRLVRVVDVNRRAREFYGAATKEELLTRLPELFDQAAYDVFRREIVAFAQGRLVFDSEIAAHTLSGESRTADMRVSLVPAPGAPWSRVIVAFTDITERQRLEEHLRHAQKLESVGRLAGGIAHDFNNLLTVINGNCELLLGRIGQDSPFREQLTDILQAGERARDLTQALLAFSRKQVLQPRLLDLNAVVAKAERLLRRVIGEHVALETALATGLLRVRADPVQIEQVLINLAANARDAMPAGGKLTIRTGKATIGAGVPNLDVPPGPYTTLAVSDTGAGIPKEARLRLFEPFFTTKDVGKGTGLGLASVFGIVKQSGGEIVVQSEPGLGTTFRIYLPGVEGEPETGEEQRERCGELRGRETILVVEDQPDVRKLITRQLEQQGYRVLEAGSGPEAVELCRAGSRQIDLLVTDWVMPGMMGSELAYRLREFYPDLKFLYTSGFNDISAFESGIQAPGGPLLRKPFTQRELAEKIRETLGG